MYVLFVFAGWFADDREDPLLLLRRAAEMGNAFACSTLCEQIDFINYEENQDDEEFFCLAQLAALQHERDGFCWHGECFADEIGCEEDLDLAKQNILIGAELGHIWAADRFGYLLDESDPVRWLWLGRAALRGLPYSFLDSFSKQVNLFFSGSRNATVVFLIGRALKGEIDMEKKESSNRSLIIWHLILSSVPQIEQSHFTIRKSNPPVSQSTHGL